MREEIIAGIRRLAAQNGQPPGQKLFASETGIREHQWRGRFWSRWGDALTEAGYAPNQWNSRGDSAEVLAGYVVACRHYGRIPTGSELEILRRSTPEVPHPNVVKRHFGRRSDLMTALVDHVAADASAADIAAMLPERADIDTVRASPVRPAEGSVYLIKSGAFFKIGRSDDLKRRVKEIRIALPDRTELIHSIRTDDPSGIEAYWHRRFADRRANGEWFKLAPQDLAAFRKRKFQ